MFIINKSGNATLTACSTAGQKVWTRLSGNIDAGAHAVIWDGLDEAENPVSSGVCFSRLQPGGMTATGKMLLANRLNPVKKQRVLWVERPCVPDKAYSLESASFLPA